MDVPACIALAHALLVLGPFQYVLAQLNDVNQPLLYPHLHVSSSLLVEFFGLSMYPVCAQALVFMLNFLD